MMIMPAFSAGLPRQCTRFQSDRRHIEKTRICKQWIQCAHLHSVRKSSYGDITPTSIRLFCHIHSEIMSTLMLYNARCHTIVLLYHIYVKANTPICKTLIRRYSGHHTRNIGTHKLNIQNSFIFFVFTLNLNFTPYGWRSGFTHIVDFHAHIYAGVE